jgi:hypothetical protein
MATPTIRVYLIYSEEDYKFRDQLMSQAKSSRLPVEFSDMPTKQPWVERWKATCRQRAFQCDAAIVLVSRKTKQASGVKWELECITSAQLPTLAILTEKVEKNSIPEELDEARVVEWNWPEIATFITSLKRAAGAPGGR